MTSLGKRSHAILLVWLVAAGVVQAQQLDSPYLPAPRDSGGVDALTGAQATGPMIPGVSEAPPTWAQERTTTNHAGTVLNTHLRAASEDESWYQRDHVVTDPRGQMIQSWERSQGEEGYLYRQSQTFQAPDGTQLRQHERALSGSDPYNYTQQHEIQLRDGRTIMHSQTRSWDGTTGTRERTFTGPNGQTRQFQGPWAPDEPLSPDPTVIVPKPTHAGPATVPAPPGGAGAVLPPVEQPKKKTWGWLEKLNPFRKGGPLRPSRPASAPPPDGSGFTVGSGPRGNVDHVPQGLSNKQPGQPSPNWRRPPWAQAPRPSPPPHRPSPPPTAFRPTPSHGKSQ